MATISQDASASITTPNELIVHTPFHDLAEYHGTRAMLEAEGVIPEATQWPTGYDDLRWEDSQNYYWLCRCRPDGAKGPRKQFVDVDWWHLRFGPINSDSIVSRELKRRAKALSDYAYSTSDKGRSERSANFNRYLETRKDEKFQSFKALIPGLIKPPRTRRTQNATQSQGAAS